MKLSDISLVLATRDEAHNIRAFLGSIPPEIQLIVVDASRDQTPDLIECLRPLNTLVLREPSTVTEARQRGAEIARTEWLLFSDADVVFDPHYFSRLSRLDCSMFYYGPKLSRDRYQHYYRWFAAAQRLSHRLGIPAASGSNMLMPRTMLIDVGGFDARLNCNEDSELGWRIKRAGYRTCFISELLVYATDHRRIERGRTAKTLHSIIRCILLYTGLMPEKYRRWDWGYWQDRNS